MPDDFLTVAQIAEMLQLNQQTVRNIIDRGELPAVRVGSRRVRVLRSDLTAFLDEGRRLTKKSPARVAYDDAMGIATKASRGTDGAAASATLRSVSAAALVLAAELEDPDEQRSA